MNLRALYFLTTEAQIAFEIYGLFQSLASCHFAITYTEESLGCSPAYPGGAKGAHAHRGSKAKTV